MKMEYTILEKFLEVVLTFVENLITLFVIICVMKKKQMKKMMKRKKEFKFSVSIVCGLRK